MKKQSPDLAIHRGGAAWLATIAAAVALSACAVPVVQTRRVIGGPDTVPMAPASYARFGTVTRIEEIDTRVGISGGGAALGGAIGGVVGNQVGHGTGRAAATVLGIFGGAIVGDNVERSNAAAASGTIYRVFVRFDDGGVNHFDYRGLGGLHSGERVRLEHGALGRV